MKKYVGFLLPLLSLDILTKIFAIQYIPPLVSKEIGYPYGGIGIFDWANVSFSLNTVYNSGAAWGIFQGYSGLLFIARAMIIVGLAIYLFSAHRNERTKTRISLSALALWLVITGAIGNSLDYLAYGRVVDFLHACFWGYSFPVFNFADCYITIGVFALLVLPRNTISPA